MTFLDKSYNEHEKVDKPALFPINYKESDDEDKIIILVAIIMSLMTLKVMGEKKPFWGKKSKLN